MPQSVIQVDSFTSLPFAGNPAAVCVLAKPRDEKWMQDVAREMNLSETAFVVKHPAENEWLLRWFTPGAEVDLCGHATLASAHVLFEDGLVSRDEAIHFQTRSGRLSVRSSGGWLEMDFPSQPAQAAPPPAWASPTPSAASRPGRVTAGNATSTPSTAALPKRRTPTVPSTGPTSG